MTNISSIINDEKIIKRIERFLIILFIVLIVWDFHLALDRLDNNTISRVIQTHVDSALFILTYFWGAIAANVFFPLNSKPTVNPTIGTIIMYVIAILIWVVDAEKTVDTMIDVDLYKHGLGMVFGFIIGLLFWRQRFFNN